MKNMKQVISRSRCYRQANEVNRTSAGILSCWRSKKLH